MTFEEQASFTAYKGPVFRVESRRFGTPDGEESFVRDVVQVAPAVAIVTYDRNLVTLIRQFRAPLWDDLTQRPVMPYELPAGRIDKDETPFEAAARELREEVGIVAENMIRMGVIHLSPGVSNETLSIFLASNLTWEGHERQGPEERGMMARQHTLDSALAMTRDGRITDAKTIIGLNWAERLVR